MFYKDEIDGKTYNFTVDSKGEKHFLYFANNFYDLTNDYCHLAAYEDNGILKLFNGFHAASIDIKQLNEINNKNITQQLKINQQELNDFIEKYKTQKQEFLAIENKLKVPTQVEIKKQVENEVDPKLLKSLFDEI